VKIPGLEKWRFLTCALHSVSWHITCSGTERQSVTGSLPGMETASREVRSSSLQQENYKGWIRKKDVFTLFCYCEDTQNVFKINKVGLGR